MADRLPASFYLWPSEKISGISVEYADDIADGDSIGSAAAVATWLDGTSATGVLWGDQDPAGTTVELGLQHTGDDDKIAIVTVQATMASGQVLGKQIQLNLESLGDRQSGVDPYSVVPGEEIDLSMGFSSIDAGDSVDTSNVFAQWLDDGTDAAVILSGSETIAGDTIEQTIQHPGAAYQNRVALVVGEATMTPSNQVYTIVIQVTIT